MAGKLMLVLVAICGLVGCSLGVTASSQLEQPLTKSDLADNERYQVMHLVAPLADAEYAPATSSKRNSLDAFSGQMFAGKRNSLDAFSGQMFAGKRNSLDAFSGQMFAGKRAPANQKGDQIKPFDAFSGQMFAGKRDWSPLLAPSWRRLDDRYEWQDLPQVVFTGKRSLLGTRHQGSQAFQLVNFEPVYSRQLGARGSHLIDLYLPANDAYESTAVGANELLA